MMNSLSALNHVKIFKNWLNMNNSYVFFSVIYILDLRNIFLYVVYTQQYKGKMQKNCIDKNWA